MPVGYALYVLYLFSEMGTFTGRASLGQGMSPDDVLVGRASFEIICSSFYR